MLQAGLGRGNVTWRCVPVLLHPSKLPQNQPHLEGFLRERPRFPCVSNGPVVLCGAVGRMEMWLSPRPGGSTVAPDVLTRVSTCGKGLGGRRRAADKPGFGPLQLLLRPPGLAGRKSRSQFRKLPRPRRAGTESPQLLIPLRLLT